MPSAKFRLDIEELGKGIAVSVFSTILPSVTALVNSGAFPTGAEWLAIGKLALSAGTGYLIQKFFRNSDGKLFKKEAKPETPTV